ncbi:MAG: Uma2 family endonuclease [Hyphomicrobiaceae bacterium]
MLRMVQGRLIEKRQAIKSVVGEIIHGVLHAQPRPAPRHVVTPFEIAGEWRAPCGRGRGGPGGWVFPVEPERHLGDDVIVPDLAGWRVERLPKLPDTAHFSFAPDWVCEILSPPTARLDRAE